MQHGRKSEEMTDTKPEENTKQKALKLAEWFETSPIFGPIMDNLLDEYEEAVIKEGISYFFNFVYTLRTNA
jgi:hypothetical protein